MATHARPNETVKLVADSAIVHADIRTERISSYLPMKDYGSVSAFMKTASVTASDTATLQILQATDDQGSDAKILVTATSDALGGVKTVSVTASQDEMDGENGFTHVAVRMVSDNDAALLAACFLARTDASYKPVARID